MSYALWAAGTWAVLGTLTAIAAGKIPRKGRHR